MAVPIGRIGPDMFAQIMGPEDAASSVVPVSVPGDEMIKASIRTPFEDILDKAVGSLEGVSKMENQTNELINRYVEGNADLSEVMIATSKMSLAVQLAVTAVTSAVNTFKEITQMQI